jgi:hypothetical protein
MTPFGKPINGSTKQRRIEMAKQATTKSSVSAQPRFHQRTAEIQSYGTVNHALPLELEEPVRLEMTEQLNQLLADTITLRDLYKKSRWQVAGATFYQLHLLFDKHYSEQCELVDSIAERIQALGGMSLAMAADVAETTRIERPPRGRPAFVAGIVFVEGCEAAPGTWVLRAIGNPRNDCLGIEQSLQCRATNVTCA